MIWRFKAMAVIIFFFIGEVSRDVRKTTLDVVVIIAFIIAIGRERQERFKDRISTLQNVIFIFKMKEDQEI